MQRQVQVDLDRLREVFARFADIQAVYLFGSAAQGRLHAESDLDLAVVPRTAALRERKLEILTELARAEHCNVDLVILDRDDIVLNYEAVRLNKVIYASEEFDRGAYYSLVVRKYLDFLPTLEMQRAAYKRRILSGKG